MRGRPTSGGLSPPLDTETRDFAAFALEDHGGAEGFPAPVSYPHGVTLFREGDVAQDVFYLEHGLVKLLKLDDEGGQLIVALRSAGWFLASAACVLGRPYAVTAVAVTPCRVARLRAETFRRLVKSNPALSWRVHRMNSEEIYAQVSQVMSMTAVPARQRLETFLKNLASGLATIPGQQGVRCEVPLRQWEIAQLVGVTPPYLSQLLGELEKAGVVSRDRQTIILRR